MISASSSFGVAAIAVVGRLAGAQATELDLGRTALLGSILLLVLCMLGFAAMAAVLRLRNRRTQREWEAREARWEQPLLAVLSGEATPGSLWQLVEDEEQLYFVDYLLRYARRVRGSTRHVLEELARPYLHPVVERMTGGDAERRARAVETVAMLGFGPNAARIAAALRDPSPLVSMIAARCIARQQRPEYVDVVLAEAAHLTDWSPRQLSAVLVSMGPAAMAALRHALEDPHLPPALRAVTAESLRQLHDPDAMASAERVLATATDREVLAATLRLVAELGGHEQSPAVRPFLTHPDPVIRSAAIQALTTTADAHDVTLLQHGIDDESGWVAIQAARALRSTGQSEVLRDLARSDQPRSPLARQVLLESA